MWTTQPMNPNEFTTNQIKWEKNCPHPNCPHDDIKPSWPIPNPACTCNKPFYISIPQGQHLHFTCPVHGERIIYGGPIVTM